MNVPSQIISRVLIPLAITGFFGIHGVAWAQLRTLDSYSGNSFYSTDDDSTDAIGIGFDIHFANTVYTSLFINNNGNVTFDFPSGVANPSSILGGLAEQGGPVLAPFFADVDTTYTYPLTYGTGTLGGHSAFVVTWDDVASFGQPLALNRFQLVLIDRSDVSAGDFDFEFDYDHIGWDAGANAKGISALVGFSDAQGQSYLLAGSGVAGSFSDNGNPATALVLHQLGTPFDIATMDGRYTFNVRGGQVSPNSSDVSGEPGPAPQPSPVPEPSSYSIISAVLLILAVGWRKVTR